MTNHGAVQAQRLGIYLDSLGIRLGHVFSSNLRRAYLTAEKLLECQKSHLARTVQLQCLQECNFGPLEGTNFDRKHTTKTSSYRLHSASHSHSCHVESKSSMQARASFFIDKYIRPILIFHNDSESYAIAVVSHGIFLSHLWIQLHTRFQAGRKFISPRVLNASNCFDLDYTGTWSNTGYLELDITKDHPLSDNSAKQLNELNFATSESSQCTVGPAVGSSDTKDSTLNTSTLGSSVSYPLDLYIMIQAINSQEHLKNLRKGRGGIGNIAFNPSQKKISSYFTQLG